jgi:hypothetical protein
MERIPQLALNYDELAAALNISRSYVEHNHVRLGISSILLGRRRVFPVKAVDRRL